MSSARDSDDTNDAPYLRIRRIGDRTEVSGQATCSLGHQVCNPHRTRMDGVFVEWTWDGQRLIAHNDRYGFYPLYYFVRAGEIALAPSIPKLLSLGASGEFDDVAFAVFLRLGHCLGEDTLFAHICALPPDATLIWHDDQLRVTGGFAHPRPSTLSRDAAIDGLIALLREAVRRRVPPDDDFAVSLSGGEDSRHIVLALCAIGRRPRCVTYESWWGQLKQDPPVAMQVARELGLEHTLLRGHGSPLGAERRKNLYTSFGSYRHPQVLLLRDAPPAGVTAIFDGLAGDMARCDSLNPGNLSLMESGQFEALARSIVGVMGERFMHVLATGPRRRFSTEAAIARVAAELARHADAPNPIGSYVFWNLIRREVALAPFLLYPALERVWLPYLDHDLYDHVAALPASMLLDHRLHRDAIARAYPRNAAMPFAVGEMAWSHRWHVRRLAAELLSYLLRAPSGIVRRPVAALHLLQTMITGWPGTLGTLGPHPEKLARLSHVLQLERLVSG